MRSHDRFFYCAPVYDHLLTHATPFLERRPPSPPAPPHSKHQGCLHQPQHPPLFTFAIMIPPLLPPLIAPGAIRCHLPPTTITVSRIFIPSARRRPQTFYLSAPRNTTLIPLRARPAIAAIFATLTSSASSALPASRSAVARLCNACSGYVPACFSLVRF